jgi:orotidine-5'-phosphate decarboxylase
MSTKNDVAEVKAEKEKKKIAHWDNANTSGLLQTMKEVTIDGKHADIPFTTQEISAITKKMNAKFQLN